MAQRQQVVFSASPHNLDAQFVLAELKKLPERERSKALWTWAAGYLRGQARQVEDAPAEEAVVDAAVLDDIADLLGAL